MSERSVLQGTPTERYALNISTWWKIHTQQEGNGVKVRTVNDAAGSQGLQIGQNDRQCRSGAAPIEATLSVDILPGVGAQFEPAQVQCHIIHPPDLNVQVGISLEGQFVTDEKSTSKEVAGVNDDAASNMHEEKSATKWKNREKITFNMKPCETTIKTS